ncbi:MAG: riboflavin synthase [Chloroflexi bacterium]|nr:riboflavin synthase [Chloroflexota bacterium]
MFTGIVEEMGTVEDASRQSLKVAARKVLGDLALGDSVAINGACLTVTNIGPSGFSVDVMPETRARTNLGRVQRGERVNLERALTLKSRVGGHLVQGHVDDTGTVISSIRDENAVRLQVSAPAGVTRYLVQKGFVAVDGVSLTVTSCGERDFGVSLVGFTLAGTTLGETRPGRQVNIEIDIIAKYVEQFTRNKSSAITMDFLSGHGFTVVPGA